MKLSCEDVIQSYSKYIRYNEYIKAKIFSGSHRVPLDKVGNEVREAGIPQNAEIVVYCAGPHCPQSRLAAEKLVKLGYDNVRAYECGLEEWKQAGFNVERRDADKV